MSAGGDEWPGHAIRRPVLVGVLVPRGVRAGTDAARTRAAEGYGRRLILCTRNRMDPISGFANNGDAVVFLRQAGELSLANAMELTQAHGDGVAVAVDLNGRDNGGLAGGTAPTLSPLDVRHPSRHHPSVRCRTAAGCHRTLSSPVSACISDATRHCRRSPTAASAPGPRSHSSAVSGCISPGTKLSVVASCTRMLWS